MRPHRSLSRSGRTLPTGSGDGVVSDGERKRACLSRLFPMAKTSIRVCGGSMNLSTTAGILQSDLPQQVCVQAHWSLDGFGSAAKPHVDPRLVIGLLPNLAAHDFSQLRTRLKIYALVLQHDPHPHCGVVRRIRTRFNLPRPYPRRKLPEPVQCGFDGFCGSSHFKNRTHVGVVWSELHHGGTTQIGKPRRTECGLSTLPRGGGR